MFCKLQCAKDGNVIYIEHYQVCCFPARPFKQNRILTGLSDQNMTYTTDHWQQFRICMPLRIWDQYGWFSTRLNFSNERNFSNKQNFSVSMIYTNQNCLPIEHNILKRIYLLKILNMPKFARQKPNFAGLRFQVELLWLSEPYRGRSCKFTDLIIH